MKTCLFGGSFDPVHEGHIAIARRAYETCGLDEIVFLPCSQSPLKETSPFLSDSQRIDCLEKAVKDCPWARIDTLDLHMPRPSWSWRLIERWRELHPGHDLYWLMGTDQWEELEQWGRWQYIASMVTFIVHHRGTAPQPRPGVEALFIDGHHPASSSAIRESLTSTIPLPSGWLHPSVASELNVHCPQDNQKNLPPE